MEEKDMTNVNAERHQESRMHEVVQVKELNRVCSKRN